MKKLELQNKLVSLGAEKLSTVLIEQSYIDENLANRLELLVSFDPKVLEKKIKAKINAIKRRTRFVPWREAKDFINELYMILDCIKDDLLPKGPKLAIELLEYYINTADKVFEIVDDSGGDVGMFYKTLVDEWGKAWETWEGRDPVVLAQLVFEHILSNNYGEKDNIIASMKNALGDKGLNKLENIFLENKEKYEADSYKRIDYLLKEIAEAKDDPDGYIKLIERKSDIRIDEVCDVAQLLVKKQRIDEAINWLLTKPNNIVCKENHKCCDLSIIKPMQYGERDRFDTLLFAYDKAGYDDEADQLRWCLFEKTLSAKYYNDLTIQKSTDERIKYKKLAIKLMINKLTDEWALSVEFLSSMGEHEVINNSIIEQYDSLRTGDYLFYRPLSKELADKGFYLTACLLRRKLIDGVLEKAQSKYYKYAVSDLGISEKYAENVENWESFPDQEGYIELLKLKHGRKAAFWSKVKC